MPPTRRQLLQTVLAGATTGLIAGCAGDGDDGGQPTSTATETRTTSAPTSTSQTTDEPTSETGTTIESTATETSQPTTTSQMTDDGQTVAMTASTFSPVRLEVPTGATVVWENEDNYGHTVVDAQFHDVAESWSFESGTLGGGDSASYTFDSAGVYEYYCDIHGRSQMCGAILVGGATLDADLPCEG